jgi:hypothetical protein
MRLYLMAFVIHEGVDSYSRNVHAALVMTRVLN